MVALGGVAVSYERGTPVNRPFTINKLRYKLVDNTDDAKYFDQV